MKTLTLIRHAKSDWSRAAQPDFDRSLNKRGSDDAACMARHLADTGLRPDLIYSSPALRAAATVKPIAQAIGYPIDGIRWMPDIYLASADDLSRLVRELPATVGHAMLVGHNPGLTDLVNHLSGETIENLPTCSVVTLTLPDESWRTVSAGSGALSRLDTPRQLWRKP